MNNENIGKPKYGIVDNGIFGATIVCGMVTGVSYTEEDRIYELSFGKNKWNTSVIADSIQDIFPCLKIKSLEQVENTHGLKIKYNS